MISYALPAIAAGGWIPVLLDDRKPSTKLMSTERLADHKGSLILTMDTYVACEAKVLGVFELPKYGLLRDEALRVGLDVSAYPKKFRGEKAFLN